MDDASALIEHARGAAAAPRRGLRANDVCGGRGDDVPSGATRGSCSTRAARWAGKVRRTRRRGIGAPRHDAGTTLIEAMVVIAILAVLLGTAVPSFVRLLATHRIATTTNDFVHALATTRSEALRRGRRVYLAPRDGHWQNGWAVFIDRNDNRLYDDAHSATPDEVILVRDPMPATVVVTNSSGSTLEPFSDGLSPRRSYVMFDGSGYSRQHNGALHFGGMVLSDRSGGATQVRTICLGSYGRVRVVEGHAGC